MPPVDRTTYLLASELGSLQHFSSAVVEQNVDCVAHVARVERRGGEVGITVLSGGLDIFTSHVTLLIATRPPSERMTGEPVSSIMQPSLGLASTRRRGNAPASVRGRHDR
jgi:hypothetical protein